MHHLNFPLREKYLLLLTFHKFGDHHIVENKAMLSLPYMQLMT